MREIIVWAQSVCRSTMALFRDVKRQAGVPVTVVMRRDARGEDARRMRESQGQGEAEFADVVGIDWDGSLESGRTILAGRSAQGVVHVFSGYQVSAAVRTLICEAHGMGLRVAEYDEAPCEMCVGWMGAMKRFYYRWVLPVRLRRAASAADVFINASGTTGIDRLVRLGWAKEKIVPFGYCSPALRVAHPSRAQFASLSSPAPHASVNILHTGRESACRDVATARRAVALLQERGISAELKCTAGRISPNELAELYRWADVFVACGLCEPWGMRVNDAIHAGLPVVVSDGMGASWLVEQFGCGCIFAKGDAESLADSLARFSQDADWSMSLASGVSAAHAAWTPEARAKVFLDILGK